MTHPLATIAFLSGGYLALLALRLTVREYGPRIRQALIGLRPKR